ncbi:CYTH and CHAD domain-containing protein [Corynebacterium sp. zg-331]|uniref:CYTH and CHAD domain-containing protein n=1 Tax=unclassified Corynebacterium TaxID=2624378 RepID=UPI00128B52AA|nr:MULTISPECIES: CYTH and CHAD domain-containing protein [unclassified Corynebacterium]MBC3185159.1 CYTH and CHAD domain-containing protein [Corynebacterium sp. zg-331]MPV51657.1 CHAD domain-containing protein [Corynebacterium sp. zg331]
MSTTHLLEVETKYSVHSTDSVPDLTKILNVHSIDAAQRYELTAIYYDTRDLRLTRSKITLRRRLGGKDDGWHLKLPDTGSGRTEIGATLNTDTNPEGECPSVVYGATDPIPAELLHHVRAIVRRHKLIPIAQVDNLRVESSLRAEDGSTVADFCDDRVTAWSLLPDASPEPRRWREWEFELAESLATTKLGRQILESADEQLTTVGAMDSHSPSKLLTALGTSFESAPTPPIPLVFRKYDDRDEAFAGVLHALIATRDSLVEQDPGARRSDRRSVRTMLNATRDLRSVLTMFIELFAHERWDNRIATASGIETELEQLTAVLHRACDADAVAAQVHDLLDADGTKLIDHQARQRLEHDVDSRKNRAYHRVTVALNSERYLTMLDTLDEFLADPPLPGRMERRKATAIIVRAVKRSYVDFKKLRSSALEVFDDPEVTELEYEEHLSQMHKVAERLRTVSRVAREFTPYDSARLSKASKQLVDTLLEAQYSVSVCELILKRARQAAGRTEDTFAYGLLYQAERERSRKILREIDHRHRSVKSSYKRFKHSIA